MPTNDGRVRQLEEEVLRQRRVLAMLRDVSSVLTRADDASHALRLISEHIRTSLGADRATLYLREEDGSLVSHVVDGKQNELIRLAPGEGIAGHVARTGKALLVPDAYKDPRFDRRWDKKNKYRTAQVLAVPLLGPSGMLVGVAQLFKGKDAQPFSKDEKRTFELLAAHAAVALENVRLVTSLADTESQLRARVADLRLLFELEKAMSRARTLEQLLSRVLREARSATGATAGAVCVRDPETSALTLYLLDMKDKQVRAYPMNDGEGLIGEALSTGLVVRADSPDDPRLPRRLDAVTGFRTKNAIAVPLEDAEQSSFGAFALYNKDGSTFSGDDEAILRLIAANASTAIRLKVMDDAHAREERLTSIGRVMSGVVHDLRTPLAVLRGYLDAMVSEDDKRTRAAYAGLAVRQFDAVRAMQEDLLQFARGEKTLLIQKVHLAPFVRELEASLLPELTARGVKLIVKVDDKGIAYLDRSKVLRALQNLGRNAAEAMANSKRKELRLRVYRDGDLVFELKDTGPGIAPEIEHRLFRSFASAGKKGGTGLGLAVVKRVIDEHGGRIEVESSRRGACFRLRLPSVNKGQKA